MDGQLQLHGGGKLPALVNNASADLVMQANCLADEDQRVRWSRKNTSHMLDTGTELFVRVQLVYVPEEMRSQLEKMPHGFKRPCGWVKVVLYGYLKLAMTLGKKVTPMDRECKSPALAHTAKSVHEAYKQFAIANEPARRSNAANVFSVVFITRAEKVHKLNDIRDQLKNASASVAARPPARTLNGHESATKTSHVDELWVTSSKGPQKAQDSSLKRQAGFVFPPTVRNALQGPWEALLNHQKHLKSKNHEGNEGIFSRYRDPAMDPPDIAMLGELRIAIEQAILETHDSHVLAAAATSEFLPGEETGSNLVKEAPWQFRWRDDSQSEIHARLIRRDDRTNQEILSSGTRKKKAHTPAKERPPGGIPRPHQQQLHF